VTGRLAPLLVVALLGVALVGVALLAGCGGSAARPPVQRPTIPRTLASAWRAQADAVAAALAAHDGCLAQQRMLTLRIGVIQAVNERRVSPKFQETLVGAVNDLTSRIRCVPPPAPAGPAENAHEKPHENPHHGGKHKGHGGEGDG
jgi:hypothetical protein